MAEITLADGDVMSSAEADLIDQQLTIQCTSATRPTGYEGRMIFETDTNKLMIYDGTTWRLAGGSGWVDIVPTFTNLSTSATDGAYCYADGGMWVKLSATANGAATGAVTITIPNSETARADGITAFGICRLVESGVAAEPGYFQVASGATTVAVVDSTFTAVNATVPFTWGTGDSIDGQIFIPL